MRRHCALFVAALLCLTNGCVLGVGWLPDSSGFVFTTPNGELIAYDVATKKQRVVIQDPAAATTFWPAISPSGKKVALAHLYGMVDKKEAVIQFVICDLQGKVEFRSDKLMVAKLDGKDFQYSTQVSWSPDEKKLLVHAQGVPTQGNGFDHAALFDIAAMTMQIWEEQIPACFGGSPVRPDGAGFLLGKLKSPGDVGTYFWVDWTGKAQKIAAAKHKVNVEPITKLSALLDSRWDGVNAILTLSNSRSILDTKMLQQTVQPIPATETSIDKESIRMRAKLESGIELLMLVHDDSQARGGIVRIVARKPTGPALTEIIAPFRDQDRAVLLNAAPNRKSAIVRVSHYYRGSRGDTIYVLNNAGKLHDTIDVQPQN